MNLIFKNTLIIFVFLPSISIPMHRRTAKDKAIALETKAKRVKIIGLANNLKHCIKEEAYYIEECKPKEKDKITALHKPTLKILTEIRGETRKRKFNQQFLENKIKKIALFEIKYDANEAMHFPTFEKQDCEDEIVKVTTIQYVAAMLDILKK